MTFLLTSNIYNFTFRSLSLFEKFHFIVSSIIVLAIITLYSIELYNSFNNIKGDKVSEVIRRWAYNKQYFIILFWGCGIGHLFLGHNNNWISEELLSKFGLNINSMHLYDAIVIAFVCFVALIHGLFFKKNIYSSKFRLALFIIG